MSSCEKWFWLSVGAIAAGLVEYGGLSWGMAVGGLGFMLWVAYRDDQRKLAPRNLGREALAKFIRRNGELADEIWGPPVAI